VVDASVHGRRELEEFEHVGVAGHVASVEMYDVRWREGGDESARLVGGWVAEDDAAARGVELADQGLAGLRGAVG
jgi:hypothetical protein